MTTATTTTTTMTARSARPRRPRKSAVPPPYEADVRIGDFVRSTLCGVVCGFVTRRGHVMLPGGPVPASTVAMADGDEQIIFDENIEVVTCKHAFRYRCDECLKEEVPTP
jgi:hypothetical protein